MALVQLAKQARIYRVTNVWVTFSICLTYRRAIYVMPDYIGTSKVIVYKSFNHSGCLDSKKILSTIDAPIGVPSVNKTHFFYKWKCFPFALRLPLEDTNFKNHQIEEKTCFLRLFQIFFNLRAILAHQTSTGLLGGSWRIWDPWGRINSGDARVLGLVGLIDAKGIGVAQPKWLWYCLT